MSSDMMNNQLLKDTVARPSQNAFRETAKAEQRQPVAASGKELPPEKPPVQEVTQEQAKKVVEQLNNHAQSINRDLLFSVDDDSGKTVIKVVNSETAELVRQIPSEEVLKLAQTIRESLDDSTGVIVQTSA